MAQQVINVGSAPNDGLGDPIRTAYIKCNDNFNELYANVGNVGNYIQNGTSNVKIASANSTVTISVNSFSNVGVFYGTGANITGYLGVSGNIKTEGLFSATGNVTGNTISSTSTMQLAVYANATVRDSSITSPSPGMMIYVTGTGMQVRGATSWNTVAGTGT
jgi:hypothetical protein